MRRVPTILAVGVRSGSRPLNRPLKVVRVILRREHRARLRPRHRVRLLKLLGLGAREYVADEFNVFDGVIVVVSVVELSLLPPAFLTESRVPPHLDAAGHPHAGDGGGALSALRTFRLFRVIKLATKLPKLQRLLIVIIGIVRAVANFVEKELTSSGNKLKKSFTDLKSLKEEEDEQERDIDAAVPGSA